MQISETPTLVGRGSHVGIVIDDPSVSSTHAELVRRGGVVWVRDLASTNGTWVNSQRVTGEVMVPDGAVVQFGLIAYTLHGGGISENAPEPAQTMIVNRSVAFTPASPTVAVPLPPAPPLLAPNRLHDAGYGPSPAETRYVPAALEIWLRVVLMWYAGLTAAFALGFVLSWHFLDQLVNQGNDGAYDSLQHSDGLFHWSYGLSLLDGVAVFVLLIVWSFKAHTATSSLWPGQRRWVRGWTIGAWFIPFANYILVPMVLTEVWKLSNAPRSAGKAEPGWARGPGNKNLILWMVFFGAGGLLLSFGKNMADVSTDYGEYKAGAITGTIGAGLLIAGCVMAIIFIRDLSKRLSPSI